MKTAIIVSTVDNDTRICLCGLCFCEVNNEDKYCRDCGAEFLRDKNDEPEIATDYKELKKINEVQHA